MVERDEKRDFVSSRFMVEFEKVVKGVVVVEVVVGGLSSKVSAETAVREEEAAALRGRVEKEQRRVVWRSFFGETKRLAIKCLCSVCG